MAIENNKANIDRLIAIVKDQNDSSWRSVAYQVKLVFGDGAMGVMIASEFFSELDVNSIQSKIESIIKNG